MGFFMLGNIFSLDLRSYSFHRQATKKIENLNATFSKMEDAYRELCLMFSENPKTMDPSDLFGIFSKFIKDWKVCTILQWTLTNPKSLGPEVVRISECMLLKRKVVQFLLFNALQNSREYFATSLS